MYAGEERRTYPIKFQKDKKFTYQQLYLKMLSCFKILNFLGYLFSSTARSSAT